MQTEKRFLAVCIAATVLLASSVGWLGLGAGRVGAQAEQNEFRIGMLQQLGSLNPFSALESTDYIVYNQIYDCLTSWDQDWKPMPNIAESWEILSWAEADDPATEEDEGTDRLWRYHIRDDAYWHDGVKLTPEDVNYTLNLNLNEDPMFWAFSPYMGKNYFSHAEVNPSIPNAVDLYLKVPMTLIDTLAIPIVPKHIFGEMTPAEVLQYANDYPIGTGPFEFVEYVTGDHLSLEANDDYHWGRPKIDGLQFIFYGNDQVMAEALKRGDIDIARFPSAHTYNTLKGRANIETAEARMDRLSDIGFNCYADAPPEVNPCLRDERVRQAVHWATNKQFLVDAVLRGYADLGTSLTVPAISEWFFEPGLDRFTFDLDKANETLDAAGYVWNAERTLRTAGPGNPYAPQGTPLRFEMMVRNNAPEDVAMAPYLKAWYAIIGVRIDLVYVDEATMETRVYWNADHEMYIWYWGGAPDPRWILEVQTSNEIWGWSDTFWSNETYDALYALQLVQSGAERNATIQQMLRIHYLSSPLIVISYPWILYAWRTDTWTGFGDVASHPNRGFWNYYAPNAMLMEVEPIGGDEAGEAAVVAAVVGVVAAVVIIAAVAAYVLLSKRKKAGGREQPPEGS